MNLRDFLKIGAVTTALVLGGRGSEVSGLEDSVNATNSVQQIQEEKISTADLIRAATLEDCVGFVEAYKENTPFKQQIQEKGFEKTAEHLAEMKYFSIALADKYSKTSDEIPENEYIEASRHVGTEQIKFKKGHTNPLDKNVIITRAKTLKIATEGHRKILSRISNMYDSKDASKQYFELVRENFTREEYTNYCGQMADAMDEYYDALANSLGLKRIFGQGDINKLKVASRESYFKVRDKIYPAEK